MVGPNKEAGSEERSQACQKGVRIQTHMGTNPPSSSSESTELIDLHSTTDMSGPSINSLSNPNSSTATAPSETPTQTMTTGATGTAQTRSAPVGISTQDVTTFQRAGIQTVTTSIKGRVMWEDNNGITYKRTDTGLYMLDESIPGWVPMVPQQRVQPPVQTAAQPGTQQPIQPQSGNSWTNMEVRDIQEIMSRCAGSSPLASERQERVRETAEDLGRVDNLVSNCHRNIAELSVQAAEPQPGTSGIGPTQVDPVFPARQPIGKQLRQALYKHVSMPNHEKAFKGEYVEYKQLLLDPLLPLKSQKLSFIKDSETGNFEWVEKSSVKDVTNFDTWLKAHMVYAAMYLDAHPERALEMVYKVPKYHT